MQEAYGYWDLQSLEKMNNCQSKQDMLINSKNAQGRRKYCTKVIDDYQLLLKLNNVSVEDGKTEYYVHTA